MYPRQTNNEFSSQYTQDMMSDFGLQETESPLIADDSIWDELGTSEDEWEYVLDVVAADQMYF